MGFGNAWLSRRGFCGMVAAGVCSAVYAKEGAGPLVYRLVNQTGGRWKDEECFWSLDDGKTWTSFAAEASPKCPVGNGRLYFRLGEPPRNFDDREAYWDFIEYAYGNGTWNGNTTQVDAFCIPLTIEMGANKVGIVEPRVKLFEAFKKECPPEFRDCVRGDKWILSPARAGFRKGGPHGDYFDKYVDEIWVTYTGGKETPSGKYTGRVIDGALTFTPTGEGKPITCASKPSTQDILLGERVLANNAAFCGAFNRHVAGDPAEWRDVANFYAAQPCNWYARFLHQHTIDHKCYGFCYDDASEQAAFFSGKGSEVTVTIYWDEHPNK